MHDDFDRILEASAKVEETGQDQSLRPKQLGDFIGQTELDRKSVV